MTNLPRFNTIFQSSNVLCAATWARRPSPARTPDWETPCRVQSFWENQHAPVQKSQVDLSQWGKTMEKLPNPLSSTQIRPKISLSLLTQNEVKCCSLTLKSTSSHKERFLDQKIALGSDVCMGRSLGRVARSGVGAKVTPPPCARLASHSYGNMAHSCAIRLHV